jgi:predicted DNA-binding transcriptional regulator AlpA
MNSPKSKRKPAKRRKRKAVVTPPINQRLGFRVNEWAVLTGQSRVTVWRNIKAGKIPLIGHGSTKVIPRSYAIKAGYITEDDNV